MSFGLSRISFVVILGLSITAQCISLEDLKTFAKDQRSLLKTGDIIVEYKEFEDYPLENVRADLRKDKEMWEQARDERIRAILESNEFDEQTKASRIQQIKKQVEKRINEKKAEDLAHVPDSPKLEIRKRWQFDFSNQQLRIEEALQGTAGETAKQTGSDGTYSAINLLAKCKDTIVKGGLSLSYHPLLKIAEMTKFPEEKEVFLPTFQSELGIVPDAILGGAEALGESVSSEIDGEYTEILELHGLRSELIKLYLLPEFGFRYRRIDIYAGDILSQRFECGRYIESDGIPLPASSEIVKYATEAKSGPTRNRVVSRIVEAKLNVAIGPEVFTVSMPSDTRVYELGAGGVSIFLSGERTNDLLRDILKPEMEGAGSMSEGLTKAGKFLDDKVHFTTDKRYRILSITLGLISAFVIILLFFSYNRWAKKIN